MGELIEIAAAMAMLISDFAPYVIGLVFDATGNYFTAFMIVMLILFSGGIIATIMKKQEIS